MRFRLSFEVDFQLSVILPLMFPTLEEIIHFALEFFWYVGPLHHHLSQTCRAECTKHLYGGPELGASGLVQKKQDVVLHHRKKIRLVVGPVVPIINPIHAHNCIAVSLLERPRVAVNLTSPVVPTALPVLLPRLTELWRETRRLVDVSMRPSSRVFVTS